MDIGSKVKLNKLSSYQNEEATIIKVDSSGKSFIVELSSGLTLAVPKELIEI